MNMTIAPLTLEHREAWAELLAIAFGFSYTNMVALLDRLHAESSLLAWGAWDGSRLAAQYSCLVTALRVPRVADSMPVGMSINMAVHPDYRGRGLVKQMAQPVYEALTAQGGVAGVGFSNAAGVKVDQRSKGYGYRVVGQLVPTLGLLWRAPNAEALHLTSTWPDAPWGYRANNEQVCFAVSDTSLYHRFANHPAHRYCFGVWEEAGQTRGVVIYRPFQRGRLSGATLLGAYSDDCQSLVRRWSRAMWENGTRVVHLLTSPAALLRTTLKQSALCIRLPYSRSPYYLTVKALRNDTPDILFDFSEWDCVGGDIL